MEQPASRTLEKGLKTMPFLRFCIARTKMRHCEILNASTNSKQAPAIFTPSPTHTLGPLPVLQPVLPPHDRITRIKPIYNKSLLKIFEKTWARGPDRLLPYRGL
jgi:hypothetical protein